MRQFPVLTMALCCGLPGPLRGRQLRVVKATAGAPSSRRMPVLQASVTRSAWGSDARRPTPLRARLAGCVRAGALSPGLLSSSSRLGPSVTPSYRAAQAPGGEALWGPSQALGLRHPPRQAYPQDVSSLAPSATGREVATCQRSP